MTPQTCEIANSLGRGINLGNMLEAPVEGQWGVKLEPAYIDIVAGAFTTVRLPVRWSNHAAPTADATLNEEFAKRVDQVVDALLAKGVYVILDMHHYSQLSGSPLHWKEFGVEPAVLETRLVNMWRQVALRYRNRSPKLLFELLNEPTGRLDGEPWNELAPKALAAVRASNPTRAVLIGPGEWNGIQALPKLRLPPDRNLIVSIHNYDPFPFTHQGVEHTGHEVSRRCHLLRCGAAQDADRCAGCRAQMEPGKRLSAASGRVRHSSRRRYEVARNVCANGPRRGGASRHRLGVLGIRFTILWHVLAPDRHLA